MFSSFTKEAGSSIAIFARPFLIYNSLMGLSWTEKHEKKSYHQRHCSGVNISTKLEILSALRKTLSTIVIVGTYLKS